MSAVPTALSSKLGPVLRPVDHESLALLIAVIAFALGAVAATIMYWGRQLPIDGRDSLGDFTGLVAAVASAVAFGATRLIAHRNLRLRSADSEIPGIHWFDFVALSLAHGAIALLAWIGIATIMAHSFTGAIVFTTPAILLTAGATALSAYVSSISASAISPRQLSLVLAVFLVVGMVAAMLSSADPQWWKLNLSALGITHDISALAFNITLILSGVIITTIARLGTASLPDQTPRDRRHRITVRTLFVLLGILLGCVGVFPVSDFLLIHNTVATGMTVAFAALVFGLPTLIPTMPHPVRGAGLLVRGGDHPACPAVRVRDLQPHRSRAGVGAADLHVDHPVPAQRRDHRASPRGLPSPRARQRLIARLRCRMRASDLAAQARTSILE
ncbi:MAG: hypothetical protein KDB08_01000 [Microthrixaceae bacterium]|nr:hypothetical protein [Microthrixaceae bacterium]